MASSQTFGAVVDSLLASGLRVRFRAAGRSMLPTVRDGECVVVAPVDANDVVLGDVVLCQTWRGLVAHRVAAVDTGVDGTRRFTLRGDASLDLDRPVAAAEVRGRLVGVERAGRLRSLAIPGGELGRLLLAARRRVGPALATARRWLAPTPAGLRA